MSPQIPPVAILVSQHVTNYDAWKKAFDEHVAARIDATCKGHHINRGVDDPNDVHVYCPAGDANKVKKFLESPDLKEVMKKAGVQGQPTVTVMKPTSTDFIPDQKLPGMIIRHEVQDYDKWRTAYDQFDGERRTGGIVGHAVNQEFNDRNSVIVYHQAKDIDSLKSFMASPKLKKAMQEAGVVGAPSVQYVKADDFSEY